MLIEIGHTDSVDGPIVTQTRLSDVMGENGVYLSSYLVGTNAQEVRDHLFDNPGIVTHLPGNTAILDVVNPQRDRVAGKVEWVEVLPEERDPAIAADFQRFLSEFYRCQSGKPTDVEDTHWTLHEGRCFPPGEKPESGD